MLKKILIQAINFWRNTTILLLLAIIIGSTIGIIYPQIANKANQFIDPTIFIMIFLILFEVPIKAVLTGVKNLRFIGLAWTINFLIIPFIGFFIASLFFSGEPLFYTGLIIYFMAPCTDWYLGFTRLAKGNVELGATLLPINLITQLVLFPVYLFIFDTAIAYEINFSMLLEWFIKPLILAVIFRFLLRNFIDKIIPICKPLISMALVLLVAQIFSANINQIVNNLSVVPVLLLAIFIFFITTFVLGEAAAKLAKLPYQDHCLLSFTTSARNAPLMLGLATVAFPNQPLIYATIAIGMLIEFPHLATLKAILLKRYHSASCHLSKILTAHT